MALQSKIGRRQRGFSYMVAIFMLATVTLLSTRALENYQTAERREREAELLHVGQAYAAAIKMYYEQAPGTQKAYPRELKDLLLDTRAVRVRRPLRRLYRDPVGASVEWGIVKASDGGIMGVYSLSPDAPFKRSGFPAGMKEFSEATSYQDWKFVYVPPEPPIGPSRIENGS